MPDCQWERAWQSATAGGPSLDRTPAVWEAFLQSVAAPRPTAAPTVAPGFVAGTATFEGLNVVEARKQTGVFRKAVATSYARRRL